MKKVFIIILTLCLIMQTAAIGYASENVKRIEGEIEFSYTEGAVYPYGATYTISTLEALIALSEAVNAGNSMEGVTLKLTNDIELNPDFTVDSEGNITSEEPVDSWISIGDSTEDQETPFSGTFDGGENTISNLYIKVSDEDSAQGFFAYTENAIIKNLNLSKAFIINTNNNENCIGGIIGKSSDTTITGCSFGGDITGVQSTGGIIGDSEFTNISNCYNAASVTGKENIGGLIGKSDSITIHDCYNIGDITATYKKSGGIIGSAQQTNMNNCYNAGKIVGKRSVGGIVGFAGYSDDYGQEEPDRVSPARIYNCFNKGNISAEEKLAGIVGDAYNSIIENNYNVENITVNNSYSRSYAGAIVGYSYNCTNKYNYWLKSDTICKDLSVVGSGSCDGCGYFSEENSQITLVDNIDDTYITDNTVTLISALNAWVEKTNLASNKRWIDDSENINNGFPIYSTYWSPDTVKVCLYSDDGEKLLYSEDYKLRQQNVKLPGYEPLEVGKRFLGWATTENAKAVEYSPLDTFEPKENLNLYAVWEIVEEENAKASTNTLFNSKCAGGRNTKRHVEEQLPDTKDNEGYDLKYISEFTPERLGVSFSFGMEEEQITVPAKNAQLLVLAYDVDAPYEKDNIYLVDELDNSELNIGTLSGMTNEWNTTVLNIPLSLLKKDHNYHLNITVSDDFKVTIRNVFLILDGGQESSNIMEKDISMKPIHGGVKITTLLKTAEDASYNLEYKFSKLDENGNTIQLASNRDTITTVASETAENIYEMILKMEKDIDYQLDVTINKDNAPITTITKKFTYDDIVDGSSDDSGSSHRSSSKSTDSKHTGTVDGKNVSFGNVDVKGNTSTGKVNFNAQTLEKLAKDGASIEIKSANVKLDIPSSAIDTDAIIQKLGIKDKANVYISTTIKKIDDVTYDFGVTAISNGKSYNIDRFSNYMKTDIELPENYDGSQITTAIRHNNDGTTTHIPTYVYYDSKGKWYARINRVTCSKYELILNNASFADTKNKWYEDVVTEMASRTIVFGHPNGEFNGDEFITRTEFATLLVRTLGLPSEGTCDFTDVSAKSWYSDIIGVAHEYGVVNGIGNNKFSPNAYITRQEAMQMIMNISPMINLSGGTASMEGYSDLGTESSWASKAVKFNLQNKLIQGNEAGLINPHANISRAESITILLRMMQNNEMFDIRTDI